MNQLCKRFGGLLLLAVILLTACGQLPEKPRGSADEAVYTFTDSSGAEISLQQRPETVAVLFSSYAEIWNLAGGTVSVTVGESVERGFSPEGTTLVDSGAGKTIDLERLLAAKPDFVIGSADIEAQAEACRILAGAGVPSALFRVDTLEDYLSMLKICTDITGNEAAYAAYGEAVREAAGSVLGAVDRYLSENSEKRTYLFIRAGSQYSSTKAKRAPENFVCTMLDELGGSNIADEAAVLLDGLSLEEILRQDPDHIFLTAMGSESAAQSYVEELFRQDGWRSLSAVRNGNYTFLSKDMFHYKPNAQWGEAYALLAELLYPELKLNA